MLKYSWKEPRLARRIPTEQDGSVPVEHDAISQPASSSSVRDETGSNTV
jgi:hypothetical protein